MQQIMLDTTHMSSRLSSNEEKEVRSVSIGEKLHPNLDPEAVGAKCRI